MSANEKKFKNACFISYKHPPKWASENHLYREFAETLRDRLEFYLSTEIRAYIDLEADPGTFYPENLSRELCQSVCMIAVLVPEYWESNWCQAEWEAMEEFEAKRLGDGKRGLIIPIALRRPVQEWRDRLNRNPVDFTKVMVPKDQLKGAKYSEKIQHIANVISRFVQQMKECCDDCKEFRVNLGKEELKPDPTFEEPNPFE